MKNAESTARLRAGAVLVLTALLTATTPAATHAQAPDLAAITSRLQAETERILRDTGIPAISIALIRDGRVAWAEAFGYANVGAGVRATAETFFSTGSTLKPVTAAAIMQLVEDGRFTLDTPFNEIVGADHAIEGAGDVTLRHMLAHHAGLEAPLTIVPLWSRQPLPTPEALLAITKRTGPPGEEYRYCNECYMLAGYVIERVSGQSYDAFLSERIFAPLGIAHALPSLPTPAVIEHLALPYSSENGESTPIEQIRTDMFAAGDAYLRARDMAAFLAMLLNGGSYGDRRILSPESAAEILKQQFEGSGSGLGISVSELSGRDVVTKNGIFTGYHSHMIGDPATRNGAYVVANSTAAGRVTALLARLALRLLWGEQEPLP